MTPARKRRLWEKHDGKCICGVDVPMFGRGVTYDHAHQLAMGGPEEDDNVRPLCDDCVAVKNAADAAARGKVRRIRKKLAGEHKPRGRKIQSPGFRKDITRRMNGKVEPR